MLMNAIGLLIPLVALVVGINALRKKNSFIWKRNVYLKKSFQKKWISYAIVFKTVKDAEFFKFAFLAILILRICGYHAIIAYLSDYPLLQIYLIIALNLIMQIYYIIASPFKKFTKQLLYIAQELILLIINVSIFLIITDTQPDFTDVSDSRNSTAYAIIYCYVALVLLGSITLTVQIIQRVREIINPKKPQSRQLTTESSMIVKTNPNNNSSTMKHLHNTSILQTSFEKMPPREEMQFEEEQKNEGKIDVIIEDSPRLEETPRPQVSGRCLTFGASPSARKRTIFTKNPIVCFDGEYVIGENEDVDLWRHPDIMLFDPDDMMTKGENTQRKTLNTLVFKDEHDPNLTMPKGGNTLKKTVDTLTFKIDLDNLVNQK